MARKRFKPKDEIERAVHWGCEHGDFSGDSYKRYMAWKASQEAKDDQWAVFGCKVRNDKGEGENPGEASVEPERTAGDGKVVCPTCGRLFEPANGNQKYCSYPCRYKSVHPPKYGDDGSDVKEMDCPECGTHFVKNRWNHKYCCHACMERATRRDARNRAREIREMSNDSKEQAVDLEKMGEWFL